MITCYFIANRAWDAGNGMISYAPFEDALLTEKVKCENLAELHTAFESIKAKLIATGESFTMRPWLPRSQRKPNGWDKAKLGFCFDRIVA